ncbi:hypothetical protein G3T14_23505 [Methylobacterium sp. BTF04]|uniref:hypothetical protein n=1 Tax=Methylobacterium sp. BTF04 TaxID=2708300 RepID=UPI0013D51241|nr:hypothetical protein [Methylobacterium sp. BTF04]NEU15014.1 hypothetical protein [Methylobacterium sp. BTF04]
MAEIHVLPTRFYGSDQIARLCADLTQAFETGTDTGSRAHHIRADGERLLALSQQLERVVEPLLQGLAHRGLREERANAEVAMRALIDAAAALAAGAKRFPAAEESWVASG